MHVTDLTTGHTNVFAECATGVESCTGVELDEAIRIAINGEAKP
jgi:hypothetical protein